jgi:hypothetical protein
MTDNKIGINTKGIDRDIILGKEVGQGYGKGTEGKQKAQDAAAASDGSELVYEKDDGWHVSQVTEEGILNSGSLSREDNAHITLYKENLNKLGIKAATISFVEEDFKNMAENDDIETRTKVAANPATPEEFLRQLAGSTYFSIREAVGKNKSAPPDILLRLASDNDYRVRIAVAGNPSAAKDILHSLANDGLDANPPNQFLFKIQQATACNPSTPTEDLRKLFGKGTFNHELSINPATPDDLLKKLFK